MMLHRVYCNLDDLLMLRFQGQKLSLRFNLQRLEKAAGGHLSRLRGRGLEFTEHRVYQAGDDLRAMDWKVTAKRSQPYTKVFHEEVEQPLILLVDQRMSMFFGSRYRFKSTLAAEVAALLLWAGLKQNDRVGGFVLGEKRQPYFKPVRQQKHALRLLDNIIENNHALGADAGTFADQDPAAECGMTTALREAKRLARPGSLCFVISDWADTDAATLAALSDLNRHHQTIAIQIFDPLEKALPEGKYAISDGHTPFSLDLRQSALQKDFNQVLTARIEGLPAVLAATGTPCIALSTWEDPWHPLRQLTARKRRGGS
jgi:uncharacterized protein (DUF58 family)